MFYVVLQINTLWLWLYNIDCGWHEFFLMFVFYIDRFNLSLLIVSVVHDSGDIRWCMAGAGNFFSNSCHVALAIVEMTPWAIFCRKNIWNFCEKKRFYVGIAGRGGFFIRKFSGILAGSGGNALGYNRYFKVAR
jgi:hypothetical protein